MRQIIITNFVVDRRTKLILKMNDTLAANIINFNSQTNGKDKLCRLIQYGSKFIWWHLHQHGYSSHLVVKLKMLESTLSTARKLLRLGKSFDHLHAACKTIHLSDTVLRVTITLSRLSQALYLLVDHLLWCGRAGLIQLDERSWNKSSARFWSTAIILNIVRTTYEFARALSREYRVVKNAMDFSEDSTRDRPLLALIQYHISVYIKVIALCVLNYRPVVLELLRNTCDYPIPMATLGRINASPGLIGLFGVISSIVGILTVWKPVFKLVPA